MHIDQEERSRSKYHTKEKEVLTPISLVHVIPYKTSFHTIFLIMAQVVSMKMSNSLCQQCRYFTDVYEFQKKFSLQMVKHVH